MSDACNSTVLLVGSGRSGTTFLAKLLDSSPQVLYRHEPDSTNVNKEIPFLPVRSDYERYLSAAGEYVDVLAATNTARSVATLPVFTKSYRSYAGNLLYRVLVYGTKLPLANHFSSVLIPDLVGSTNPVVVIKSVNSLCRAGLFDAARAGMRHVHIVRHPCAVIASLAEGSSRGLMSSDTFLNSVFSMPEAADYPFTYADMASRSWEERFAFQWMVQNDRTYREMRDRENYRLVVYECLCASLQEQAEQLFVHTGVEWGRSSKEFVNRLESMEDNRARYFSVMRNPRSAMFKWKDRLSRDTVNRIIGIVRHSDAGNICLDAVEQL